MGNASTTTDKNDFVNIRLVSLGISKDFFDGFKCAPEEVMAKFLELGASKIGVEINTLIQRINFDQS